MQTYDWRRFARLLRIDRPECWDRGDKARPLWERGSPFRLEEDGVYLPDLALSEAPDGLLETEIEALHPGDGGKVLALPATLPKIINFLESSGEYARVPGRLWPRLQRLAARAAAFSRAWDELWKGMDLSALAFDPRAARQERFIPLRVLLSWLERLPAPGDSVPAIELFALAKRHIAIGHLQTRVPTWRYVPETFSPGPRTIDVILNEEVIGQVTRGAVIIGPLPDDPESPLIDVFKFAAWFREVSPEYLKLPEGFPEAEAEADVAAATPTREVPETGAAASELPFLEEPPQGQEPEWLTLRVMAGAFQGLHDWNEDQWLMNLRKSEAPWIDTAIQRGGKQGQGRLSKVHPVILARNLLALELAAGTDMAMLVRDLDQRFERPPLLAWRALWQRARVGF